MERRYRWRRLNVSFSGGRTSARMSKLLRDAVGGRRRNIIYTFANTGEEDHRTLDFVNLCDLAYDLGVVWLEARVDPGAGQGTRHRVVTYETASRAGEPFAAVVAKYGLPGPGFLHCTRELKINAIRSYLRSVGWAPGSYDTAIGIRADEIDRMQPDAAARHIVYPLVSLGIKKPDVLAYFSGSNVDLDVPEHLGNCTWCWKKSLTKHMRLMREAPEVFAFPERMEALHATTGTTAGRRRFLFRSHRTVDDLRRLSADPTAPADGPAERCDESCEIDMAEAA